MKTDAQISVFSYAHQPDIFRAACLMFCTAIHSFVAVPSPPLFRFSHAAFNFVCQARLARDKKNYE